MICDEITEFNLKTDEFGVYHTGNENWPEAVTKSDTWRPLIGYLLLVVPGGATVETGS